MDTVEWVRPDEVHYENRRIVLVNGCFDLLHTSHMRLLFSARERAGGDGIVLVALDSDEKVQRNKGVGRPVLSWSERAAALSYMPINAICEIDTEEDMDTLVKNLKPTMRVQGADYLGKPSRYPHIPKMIVRNGISTSDIIARIKNETAR